MHKIKSDQRDESVKRKCSLVHMVTVGDFSKISGLSDPKAVKLVDERSNHKKMKEQWLEK